MSVSRTSMSLATAVLVTVIGLGSASALDNGAHNTVAGAGWGVAPVTTDGADSDAAPIDPSTNGAGWG